MFIDARAHQSRLAPWHTGLKLSLGGLCLLGAIATETLAVPLYLLLAMTLLTVGVGRTPLRVYLSLLTLPALFIFLSCLAILVEISPEPLGLLSFPVGGWYLSVTRNTQARALAVLVRSLGAMSCLYFLSLSTPLYRMIAALRRAKVPAVVVELMYLIYRYLFILLETHQQMIHASAARLGYRKTAISLRTMTRNALNLLFISLRQTSAMLQAMEARCYNGEIRFLHRTVPPTGGQIFATGTILAGMALVWALSLGGLRP